MPMLVESLGRQRGWGSAVLQQEQFSDSEVARHLMLAGAVAQRLELFEADRRSLAELDRLLQSQGQGAGAAERLLRNAVAEAEVFSQRSLAQVLSRAGGSTTAAQHFAEGTTAIERLLAGSREVTRLLQVRTAHQQARAAAWLRVAQAALLLLLLVLAAVYLAFERTTVQRLLTLKAASGRIAAGDFDDRVAVEGSDEIAALARALDTMRQGLRQAVDDRANALAERETERERTEFLARWSHDLRTPLAAVLGFARLLGNPQHGALSAAQQADLERIETAAEHLLQLVDDVLAVSTQALREAAPLATPLALAAPVHDALTLLEPEAAARGVSLQAQLPPNLPAAQADRTRLVRVLGNLVANAVKFNQRGGWVRVSAALEGTELRIDVADNGPGIAVADQPRLFKPFERLDAGARGVPGTGLGLATVRRLLESQGGRIALTSPALAAGGGCTFSVWLPQASAGAAAPAERIHTTGHKLAYVEDNPTNVELMRAMLAVCGHDGLVVCPDGASALRAAGTGEHFDLWIIDRQLPDSDGLQLLAELTRRLGQRPHAVLFTADAMPERRQQALDAGFADCWTKPLALESLQAGLARLLS
jgi:signal transduction histidine kinase/CheY-like chemotaxis protein